MQVSKEWEHNQEKREEHGSVCFGAVQRCPTTVFHLGMGGRGGAPRVAEKTTDTVKGHAKILTPKQKRTMSFHTVTRTPSKYLPPDRNCSKQTIPTKQECGHAH